MISRKISRKKTLIQSDNNNVRLQMHCIFARPPHLVESSGTSMMSPCLKRYNNKASWSWISRDSYCIKVLPVLGGGRRRNKHEFLQGTRAASKAIQHQRKNIPFSLLIAATTWGIVGKHTACSSRGKKHEFWWRRTSRTSSILWQETRTPMKLTLHGTILHIKL